VAENLLAVHGVVRYLVLIIGVAAAIAALLAWRSATPSASPSAVDRRLAAAYTGILDLQVLLGVGLLVVRPFYGALMGHITMMVVAAIIAHLGSVFARRRAPARPGAPIRFTSIVASLAIIIGGIAAIGRPSI
jgi:hypothetical protein